MPYIVRGHIVVNKLTGRRRKFKSSGAARRWVNYNLALEHGWTPTKTKFNKLSARRG